MKMTKELRLCEIRTDLPVRKGNTIGGSIPRVSTRGFLLNVLLLPAAISGSDRGNRRQSVVPLYIPNIKTV